jgi:hypothetical protein
VGRKTAKEDAPIDPRQLTHLKKLRDLLPILAPLRDSGCARDTAGNRDLHFDEYVTLVLLYLFNPMIDSMRTLQRASAVDKLARQLGVKRFSLGSFSESVRVFEPEKLRGVITQLAGELRPLGADPRLKRHIEHPLRLADGTVLDAVTKVADAFWLRFKDGSPKHAWRLHVQFDVDTLCPIEAELTDARNSRGGLALLRKERREERAAAEARAGPLLRGRPLVRAVHALQRDRRRRQQLRLPG